MVIVFSGFRDESLKAQIEVQEGKVHNALVKDATHVLVKKDAKPSKKLEEAKEKGIECLDLAAFLIEHEFALLSKEKKAKSDDEKEAKEVETIAPLVKEKKKAKKEEEFVAKKQTELEMIALILNALTKKENVKEALEALSELEERLSA